MSPMADDELCVPLHEVAVGNVEDSLFRRSKPVRWLLVLAAFLVTLWILNCAPVLMMQ